jgi:DNA-directed RNA polymerase specialized sigma24 family protein
MDEHDPATKRIAELRMQRGPDPVPARPPGLEVPEKEWEQAWRAVLDLGLRLTNSTARADDIRQETYVRLLTTRPWRKDQQPSFLRHVLLVASSILKNQGRDRARRRDYEADWGAEHKRDRGNTTPSAEQDMLEHAQREPKRERAVGVAIELRRRLAAFPLELRIIDHAEAQEAKDEEFGASSEVAEALRVPVEQVYRALARIRRYKERVYAAVGGNDEESE